MGRGYPHHAKEWRLLIRAPVMTSHGKHIDRLSRAEPVAIIGFDNKPKVHFRRCAFLVRLVLFWQAVENSHHHLSSLTPHAGEILNSAHSPVLCQAVFLLSLPLPLSRSFSSPSLSLNVSLSLSPSLSRISVSLPLSFWRLVVVHGASLSLSASPSHSLLPSILLSPLPLPFWRSVVVHSAC